MTTNEAIHWDVAAYALGVLDEYDTTRFEEHLISCPECAVELESLLPTVELLSEVDIDTLHVVEKYRLDEQLFQTALVERARARRRQTFTLAASVVTTATVAGFSIFAGTNLLDGNDRGQDPAANPPAATSIPTAEAAVADAEQEFGGPGLPAGDQFAATDPTTGIHADVVLSENDWGTQVSFALSSVPGPLTCRLLIVRTDGTAEVVGTWRVPEEGYGTPEQPHPLMLSAATATAQADMDQVVVQAVDDSGEITTLVAVSL